MNHGIAKLLFELNGTCFYEHESPYPTLFKSNFYYKIKDNPTIHGPFFSIMSATKDYEAFILAPLESQKIEEIDMKNVIHVDFKAKKRVVV